jgi:hypothetical protein
MILAKPAGTIEQPVGNYTWKQYFGVLETDFDHEICTHLH